MDKKQTQPELSNERTYELMLLIVQRIRKAWKDQLKLYPTMKSKDLDMLAYIYIAKTPITMQDLASYLKVSAAAVSQMVASLEKKRILRKTPSEVDHRINELSLHPELVESIEEDQRHMAALLREFETFSNHEFDLEALFERVLAFAEQHEKDSV